MSFLFLFWLFGVLLFWLFGGERSWLDICCCCSAPIIIIFIILHWFWQWGVSLVVVGRLCLWAKRLWEREVGRKWGTIRRGILSKFRVTTKSWKVWEWWLLKENERMWETDKRCWEKGEWCACNVIESITLPFLFLSFFLSLCHAMLYNGCTTHSEKLEK